MAPQADRAPTTILPAKVLGLPETIYLPEIHSKKHGVYFPELRTGDTTMHTIVADIVSNQHDDVRRVIAIDLASGTSWDASKEIAHLVLDAALSEYDHIPYDCREFLEEHLGVNYVRAAERQAA